MKLKSSGLKNGQMIIIALIFITVVMILSGALFGRTANFIRFGGNDERNEQAVNLAEAGVEYAIWKLNTEEPIGSYTSAEELISLGTGEFELTVTNISSTAKEIEVTGYVPDKATARNKNTIKLTAGVSTTQIAFYYAIQTGSGGINSISGGSTINGNVWAGCKTCGVTNIVGSGNSNINGQARATGTITSQASGLSVNPEPNNRFPGLDPATAPDLPNVNYQEWRDDAGTAVCDADGSITGGTATIGNCKQTGDLTISQAEVTITGPVWITGNLTMSGNGAKLKTSNSLGSNDVVVLVDGTITLNGDAQIEANTSNPKGYILLATTNTTSSALNLSGGTQSGIFYILEGTATISGNATLEAIIAKSLTISGGSTINYNSGHASGEFSSGPGGAWVPSEGSYRYTDSP